MLYIKGDKQRKAGLMTGNYEKENDIKRLISFMVISILAFV